MSEGLTAANLGDRVRDTDDEDITESPGYWFVPHISDKEILKLMISMKERFDPELVRENMEMVAAEHSNPQVQDVTQRDVPDTVEETVVFQELFRRATGMTVAGALKNHDVHRQSSLIGTPDKDNAGGTKRLIDLVDSIQQGYVGYLFGRQGNGKTDFAILIAELWSKLQTEFEIASNIQSFERAQTIERIWNLKDWIEESDGTGNKERLMIWDEADSNASGYSADAHLVTDKMHRTLNSLRSRNASLLVIGHNGKDVHPIFRRESTDMIHKESKKTATVYESIDQEGNGIEKKYAIEGIEKTTWDYNTNEMARWFWER